MQQRLGLSDMKTYNVYILTILRLSIIILKAFFDSRIVF